MWAGFPTSERADCVLWISYSKMTGGLQGEEVGRNRKEEWFGSDPSPNQEKKEWDWHFQPLSSV